MKIQPFKLERYFAKYEFNAPYLLCASDCESFSVRELLEMDPGAQEDLQEQWLGYTESVGNPQLRKEITKLYETMTANDVLVHSGAEEAIFIFMNVALKKGDHVIVHYPCYQSLFEIARTIGCEITRWETRESEDWELDVDFLKASIRENTRAVIFNCPHNPTGYLMGRDKLDAIVEIARKNNLILFSDEVYRFLEYKDDDRLPSVSDIYEKGVSLGVMSKAFGLAGLRIGWIATRDRDVYREMATFKDYTSICNSAPSEFFSIIALRNKEEILRRNRQIIHNNLEKLKGFFADYSSYFNWQAPKAGAIAFPGLKAPLPAEEFCRDLVEKKGVLLLPGNYYNFIGGNKGTGSWDRNFRIGFGRKNLPECLEKLGEYMIENY